MRDATVAKVIETAPQGLAVNGDVASAIATGRLVQGGGVVAKSGLDRAGIKLLQDPADGRVGRCLAPGSAERITQSAQVNVDEAMDCAIGIGAGNNRQDGKQDDMGQSVELALRSPWILDFGQQQDKRRKRFHGNPHKGCQPRSRTDPRRGNPLSAGHRAVCSDLLQSGLTQLNDAQVESVEQPCGWPVGCSPYCEEDRRRPSGRLCGLSSPIHRQGYANYETSTIRA